MADSLKIALAQIDLMVGDVPGNTERMVAAMVRARDELGADLILFPELALTGYPPEDLLFHGGLRKRVESNLKRLCDEARGIAALVGYPEYVDRRAIFNAAALVRDGRILANYRKQNLPNYGVFDEKRYFLPGEGACVVDLDGLPVGLTVCEDVWEPGPAQLARDAGARLLLNINASPYEISKRSLRADVLSRRVHECGLPIVYLNLVGGQDELVFDGSSVVLDAGGNAVLQAPAYAEDLYVVTVDKATGRPAAPDGPVAREQTLEEGVYGALVLGTRDYVNKHGFPGVVIGLSGGIDSALTAAIAVDALGPDRVQVVMMPSRYTQDMSNDDAAEQARTLGVRSHVIPIEPVFEAMLASLSELFAGLPEDTTEENIQSRCRGMILMALSNKTGNMVLTTGNKSEMAVGYATLYGDMAGGFAPIKDCSKTLVYRLARFRNTLSPVIPERVITRAPSAELRPDQKDTDSLPPYDVLDPILAAFIEDDCSVDEIVERGFERDTVVRVLTMVKRNEYKRRQAPPGIRISRRAFGRDWRYPITSGY